MTTTLMQTRPRTTDLTTALEVAAIGRHPLLLTGVPAGLGEVLAQLLSIVQSPTLPDGTTGEVVTLATADDPIPPQVWDAAADAHQGLLHLDVTGPVRHATLETLVNILDDRAVNLITGNLRTCRPARFQLLVTVEAGVSAPLTPRLLARCPLQLDITHSTDPLTVPSLARVAAAHRNRLDRPDANICPLPASGRALLEDAERLGRIGHSERVGIVAVARTLGRLRGAAPTTDDVQTALHLHGLA